MPDLPQQPAFGLFADKLPATTGEQLRDAGIEQVLGNNQNWRDAFDAAAAAILARTGEVTSDAVVQVVGMPIGHPSAVGGAMRRFAVANKLSVVRYVKSTRPSCHAAIVAVWAKIPT